jgi:hypothetical protein
MNEYLIAAGAEFNRKAIANLYQLEDDANNDEFPVGRLIDAWPQGDGGHFLTDRMFVIESEKDCHYVFSRLTDLLPEGVTFRLYPLFNNEQALNLANQLPNSTNGGI